jgi:hypothetical protein
VNAGTATTGGQGFEGLTLAKLQAMLQVLSASDPLAESMRQAGFDPAEGALMVAPETWREFFPISVPSYVRFSKLVEEAYFMRNPIWRLNGL